jgi:hypothetical protein
MTGNRVEGCCVVAVKNEISKGLSSKAPTVGEALVYAHEKINFLRAQEQATDLFGRSVMLRTLVLVRTGDMDQWSRGAARCSSGGACLPVAATQNVVTSGQHFRGHYQNNAMSRLARVEPRGGFPPAPKRNSLRCPFFRLFRSGRLLLDPVGR